MTTTISSDLLQAAAVLRAGGLVAFPTETVYGLGADASNELAVSRIFTAKGRPKDHPLIVHVAEVMQLMEWAKDIPETAYQLAQAFWPGPLTLILKKQPQVLDLVTGGQQTIGLRIPKHPSAQALLRAFGGGVAAPSANQFTHVSPTTVEAVVEELNDRIDFILEGNECEVGLESTIIDLTSERPTILRPGMITAEAIEKVLNTPILTRQISSQVRTAGMHHLHYAPKTQTILMDKEEIRQFFKAPTTDWLPAAILLHSNITFPQHPAIQLVTMPFHALDYAHELYKTLRFLDHQQLRLIIVEKVPEEAEWVAIHDRLAKAAHKR